MIHPYTRAVLRKAGLLLPLFLVACGGTALPSRAPALSQALLGAPEATELEPLANRQELFKELVRSAQAQAGLPLQGSFFVFPVAQGQVLVGAPALDLRVDLLGGADAGQATQLVFEGRGERFGDERRDVFQGLSERETAELVARSLLAQWKISPQGAVRVERVTGAPYAAAWVDGVLRLNPALLPLATTPLP